MPKVEIDYPIAVTSNSGFSVEVPAHLIATLVADHMADNGVLPKGALPIDNRRCRVKVIATSRLRGQAIEVVFDYESRPASGTYKLKLGQDEPAPDPDAEIPVDIPDLKPYSEPELNS